ncbi:MAG: hypothetical protein H7235_12225 [Bdellovibrionaceae bacterium]|nr:hypothetical protein [Pseudobdellovibrionaceae bacterium]
MAGSIYDDGTESQHQFLIDYCKVIKNAGWRASKFSRENTIRVNPSKTAKDFLINPRPCPSVTIDNQSYFFEQDLVNIFAYPDTNSENLIVALEKFSLSNGFGIKFYNFYDAENSGHHHFVGHLMIPLHFSIDNKIDFVQLEAVWSKLRTDVEVVVSN